MERHVPIMLLRITAKKRANVTGLDGNQIGEHSKDMRIELEDRLWCALSVAAMVCYAHHNL